MLPFLFNHALKTIWCTPDQDHQFILQPARISPARGFTRTMQAAQESFNLPTQNDRFHVFQIGQATPNIYNLFSDRNIWIPVSKVCRDRAMVIDLYTDNGVQWPRHTVWMMITYNRNLLVAVKELPGYPIDIVNQPFYMRVYSNAYFETIEDNMDGHVDEVFVYGKLIANETDRGEMINTFINYNSRAYGKAYGFVNGYFTNRVYAGNVNIGDIVEIVYDSTIFKAVDIPVTDLEEYFSTMDSKHKYLVNTNAAIGDKIEYRDDLDFFLVKPHYSATVMKGVYYHKNQENAVRMVTHQDYSIPADYVLAYATNTNLFTSVSEMTLRIHFRKSGYARELVNEHHRIKELYKLPYDDVRAAMLGNDSPVSVWEVESLEQSDYPRIMRSYAQFVTNEMVVNAFGYNSVAKIVADSPIVTEAEYGINIARLPVGLQNASHVFEYDVNGVLTGHYNHNLVEYYPCRSSQTIFVEAMRGNASGSTNAYIDQTVIPHNPAWEYRFYVCTKANGVPVNDWEDVTGSNLYTIVNGQIIWNEEDSGRMTQVRHDGHNLVYSFEAAAVDGMLTFAVSSTEKIAGVDQFGILHVPPGIVELWLNGKSLVKDVDYCIKYPEVLIYAKEHWNQSGNQRVTVRCSGFCNSSLEIEDPVDIGYVKYGLISRNGRYNIRDDKVVRVVVGGRTFLQSQINLSEGAAGGVNLHPLNGKPYMVLDTYVPLHDYIDRPTSGYRQLSRLVDSEISDYLTVKLPEPDAELPSGIFDKYDVFSPFLEQLMYNLKDGSIDNTLIEGHYSDMVVMDIVQPYERMLTFDPSRQGLDMDVVAIHPHHYPSTVPVTQDQYRFLNRVIDLYFNGAIDLSVFVTIE